MAIIVSYIVTHRFPHLDEALAIMLLRDYGGDRYPGIEKAQIVYWGSNGETLYGRTVAEWEAEGYVFVGIGGGKYDEHPTADHGRKEGECATSLVAKDLGIFELPWLAKVLELVVQDDLHGNAGELGLAALAKLLHEQYPDNPELVMEWVMAGIEAKVRQQMAFWDEGKDEFEENTKVEEVVGPHGRKLKIAVVESDSNLVSKFARSAHGGRMAVVIQKRSTGHVQILTNPKFGLTLYDVTAMIRDAEQRKKGEMVTTRWAELTADGTVAGVPEWFFFEATQTLFNGSTTHPDVTPTRIPLEEIIELVKIGISPGSFEPERAEDYCSQGVCCSTPQDNCPWYDWGLKRCRQIRYEMRHPKPAKQR